MQQGSPIRASNLRPFQLNLVENSDYLATIVGSQFSVNTLEVRLYRIDRYLEQAGDIRGVVPG